MPTILCIGKTKEGVKDSATAGDFRSHRVMYYSLRKTFPLVKVISEEHDPSPDMSEAQLASIVNEEVEQYMRGDEMVNADDVTVWIGKTSRVSDKGLVYVKANKFHLTL